MSPDNLWIVLIIVTIVCSASCRPDAANEESTSARVWHQFKELSTRAITGLRNIAAVLTAPRLKDRQDICVWRICSRPLKKTNKIPEVKPSEIGRMLSDPELANIWKEINSRIVLV